MNVAALLKRLPPHLLRVLDEASAEAERRHEALYLVGGPVRDLLLDRPVVDLDLSVEGDGVRFARALARRLGTGRVTPSQFGTAKLQLDASVVDVATARQEWYRHPGALPVVEPATIQEDLARRDFTINAMAVSLRPQGYGQLVDPLGGQNDLRAGLVRVLHENSFVDDATRMLRGVRYEQRLGFALEEGTAALIRRDAAMLDTISGDRLRHEVLRTLEEPDPARCLRRAGELGLLAALHPPLSDGEAVAQRVARVSRSVSRPAVLLAAIAAGLSPGDAEGLVARLRLPVAEARAVRHAASYPQEVRPRLGRAEPAPSKVHRLLQPLSLDALTAWALLEEEPRVAALLRRYLEEWRHVRPALNGHDLQTLGMAPGPRLGRLLRELHDARLDGEVGSREEEEAWVRRRLGQSP